MVFESPIWLLGLLPWGGVVFYLLPGRAPSRVVSFLGFWAVGRVSASQSLRRVPPIWVWLMLLALLLAVLAAAKPAQRVWGVSDQEISIILDRGASMALPSATGEAFGGAIAKCGNQIGVLPGNLRVNLVSVPGGEVETSEGGWLAAAKILRPTVIHTYLDPVIKNQLKETRGRIFVLSDQTLGVNDSRVLQIFPDRREECVAIMAMGASEFPRPQVMVRLENHSQWKSVELTITSGQAVIHRQVMLPGDGGAVDQFVDMPSLTGTVMAEIDSDVNDNPWARAWLSRQSGGVRLVVDPGLPAAVQRIAAVYSKDRPGGIEARPLLVAGHLQDDQRGVWVASNNSEPSQTGPTKVEAHAVTQNVLAWPRPADDVKLPDGFTPVVFNKRSCIIAVRENPIRQVWINADLRDWQKTSDFVVFFGNAFDWIGDGGRFTAGEARLDAGWPGLYASGAINAGKFPVSHASPSSAGMTSTDVAKQTIPLTSAALLAALICLLAAVLAVSTQPKSLDLDRLL